MLSSSSAGDENLKLQWTIEQQEKLTENLAEQDVADKKDNEARS